MKVFLATWMEEPAQSVSLTKAKCKHRLLSYWHIKEKAAKLKRYVLTGIATK